MAQPIPAAPGEPCWIDLLTNDTDAAQLFYGALFGWTAEVAGEEYGGYTTFSKDGVQVAGCMGNDPAQGVPNVWSVYLAVEDARATVDAAEAAGGAVVMAPMEVPAVGVVAYVTDPGGAAIGLFQATGEASFGYSSGGEGRPGWFELHTRDFPASVRFYEGVFGWDVHLTGDSDEPRYATLGAGEAQKAGIMDASGFLPDGVPAHWSVYFTVSDADATVAKVVELGGQVVMGPEDTPYGRLATVTDPAGAQFKLVQPPA